MASSDMKLTAAGWCKRRNEVAERAAYLCEKCGTYIGDDGDAHHIIGRGLGGGKRDDSLNNLIYLCRECHNREHVPLKVLPSKET